MLCLESVDARSCHMCHTFQRCTDCGFFLLEMYDNRNKLGTSFVFCFVDVTNRETTNNNKNKQKMSHTHTYTCTSIFRTTRRLVRLAAHANGSQQQASDIVFPPSSLTSHTGNSTSQNTALVNIQHTPPSPPCTQVDLASRGRMRRKKEEDSSQNLT